MDKITVAVLRVGQPLQVVEIEADESNSYLKAMQEIVGGYIEQVFHVDSDLSLFCNEEGKLEKLPPNIYVPEMQDIIVGDIFFSRSDDEGESVPLLPDDCKVIQDWLDTKTAPVIVLG